MLVYTPEGEKAGTSLREKKTRGKKSREKSNKNPTFLKIRALLKKGNCATECFVNKSGNQI